MHLLRTERSLRHLPRLEAADAGGLKGVDRSATSAAGVGSSR
jgi:hypothetical protein